MYDNKRLALSIFWVVAGIALVVLSVMEVLDSSLYAGMGGGLAVVGVFQIVRNLKYRTNAEYREKVDVEVNDERNKYLRMKSWSWAGYITVLELTRAGDLIRSRTIEAFFPLISVAAIYFLLTFLMTRIARRMDRAFTVKHRNHKIKGVDK